MIFQFNNLHFRICVYVRGGRFYLLPLKSFSISLKDFRMIVNDTINRGHEFQNSPYPENKILGNREKPLTASMIFILIQDFTMEEIQDKTSFFLPLVVFHRCRFTNKIG